MTDNESPDSIAANEDQLIDSESFQGNNNLEHSMDSSGEISPELIHDPYGAEILSVSDEDFEALLNQQADLIGDFKVF